MPDFYLAVKPEEPLAQGDIFDDFPVAMPIFDPLFQLTPEGEGAYRRAAPEEGLQAGMVIPAAVEDLTPAILITQSCDTRDANRLILAPLRTAWQLPPKSTFPTSRSLGSRGGFSI